MFGPPPPPPRAASLAVASWNARFMLMFGGGWFFLPFLILVVMSLVGPPVWDDWFLDRRGRRAEAVAVAVRTTSTSLNDHDLFDIEVRFRDRRGKSQTAVIGTIDDARIATGRAHGKLPIEYDPERPSRARFVGTSASFLGGMILLPLGFMLIGVPLFLRGLLQYLRARRVYRDGVAAQAVVVAVVATPSSQNDQTVMEMRYEVQTGAGVARGAWKTVSPLPVGSPLWVIYDPKDPSKNVPSLA